MKKFMVVFLVALGVVGFAATCAIAADSEKAPGAEPVKDAVLAGPVAVKTVADAAAPAVPGAPETVDAVTTVTSPVVTGVADATAAVVAPVYPGQTDAAPAPEPKQ